MCSICSIYRRNSSSNTSETPFFSAVVKHHAIVLEWVTSYVGADTLLVIAMVSPSRCEPLRAGCREEGGGLCVS